jgi:hypothetical protein
MDREELRNDGRRALTPAEFGDAAGLLLEIGQSRNPTVRRNLIVAWAEIIELCRNPGLKEKALDYLLEAALPHGKEDEDPAIAEMVTRELGKLDKPLTARAIAKLRGELNLSGGAERFHSAIRLTNALIRRRAFADSEGMPRARLIVGSYWELWKLTLSQWAMSLRDSLPVLLLAVIVAAGLPLIISSLGSRYGLTIQLGDSIRLDAINIALFALLSLIVAVPSSSLVGWSRLLEALNQALFYLVAMVLVGIVLGLDISSPSYRLTPDSAAVGGSQWISPAEAAAAASQSTGSGVAPLLPWLALGIFVYRLTAASLAYRAPSLLIANGVGWMAGCLAAVGALLATSSGQQGQWLAMVLLVTAAAMGSTWVDYRRGSRKSLSDVRIARRRPLVPAAGIAGLVGIAVAFVHADGQLLEARRQVVGNTPRIEVPCGRRATVQIELNRSYDIYGCQSSLVVGAVYPGGWLDPMAPGRPSVDLVLQTFNQDLLPLRRVDDPDPPFVTLPRDSLGRSGVVIACVQAFGENAPCARVRSQATLTEFLSAIGGSWLNVLPTSLFASQGGPEAAAAESAAAPRTGTYSLCVVRGEARSRAQLQQMCGD